MISCGVPGVGARLVEGAAEDVGAGEGEALREARGAAFGESGGAATEPPPSAPPPSAGRKARLRMPWGWGASVGRARDPAPPPATKRACVPSVEAFVTPRGRQA